MISNLLTLKQLEAFVLVVDLGSFRKAAEQLNTTQPNISARIAGLEAVLAVQLITRLPGGVELTDKGSEILILARQILRDAEEVVLVAGRQDLISNRLRVGVTELIACTWLHDYLRRLKHTFPALTLELTVDLSRTIDAELRARRLDIAIQTAPFEHAVSGEAHLGDVAYVWVAPPHIAAALNGAQTVADLLPHGILTHAKHTQAYGELTAHLAQHGLPTARLVTSSSLASCVQMAKDGMGVALLPMALIAAELKEGALRRIDMDWHPSPLQFVARYHAETASHYLEQAAELAQLSAAQNAG